MTNKHPVVTIVHTSLLSVDDLTRLFGELAPEVELRHIVDSSLLPEVLANGGVTPGVRSRLLGYYQAAESGGADLVVSQCSSVGEVADLGRELLRIPLVKIDAAMAKRAVLVGPRIGVVATLETTLGPTCRLIERTARELGREVRIEQALVAGAFDAFRAGDRARHNTLVLDAIRKLYASCDVIACAQGSMLAIVPELGETPIPVLTSPVAGIEHALEVLRSSRST
jgi:Asp/Glu/hydantoin racemase